MSGAATKHMMMAFSQVSAVPGFFASMFTARRDTIFNSDTIEIDIERDNEDVAAVLVDASSGANINTFDQFTNKEFIPPALGEGFTLTSNELTKRMPGDTPFDSVVYQSNANALVMKKLPRIMNKIRRHIGIQASQVLQTGTLSLVDKDGNTVYTLDYKPKVTHFPNAAITWGTGTEDKLADIGSLASAIRADGKTAPRRLIFGAAAWLSFIADDNVKSLLDNRRMDLGMIQAPAPIGGGEYHGRIVIGAYEYELWTCDERYKDIATGNSMSFMDTGKVIVMSPDARLDAAFGGVPFVAEPDQRALRYLPARLEEMGAGGIAVWPNAYIATNNKLVTGEVYTRPLMIPVAIDSFGCLDTGL